MKSILSGCSALALLVLTGCGGPSLFPVSGIVKLDDKPVEGVIVAFVAVEGGVSAQGTTDADGKYSLSSMDGKGLPGGSYKVKITEITVVETGSEEEEAYASSDSGAYEQMSNGGMDQYSQAAKKKKLIPEKYNTNSTLQESVSETAENTINFDLTSK